MLTFWRRGIGVAEAVAGGFCFLESTELIKEIKRKETRKA